MKECRHLFLDFEFTMPDRSSKKSGFYPEIIEVGTVLVDNGEVLDTFSSYVKPERFPLLTSRCKSFLHITQSNVDKGILFTEFVEHLQKYDSMYNLTVVTWGNMDMKVLKQNCEASNVLFPFQKEENDLSLEYKRFFGDRNQTGLWKAVEQYGRKGTGKHHRALDDAQTTYNIFKLIEKDKQYLVKSSPATIGELVDFSKILQKLNAYN